MCCMDFILKSHSNPEKSVHMKKQNELYVLLNPSAFALYIPVSVELSAKVGVSEVSPPSPPISPLFFLCLRKHTNSLSSHLDHCEQRQPCALWSGQYHIHPSCSLLKESNYTIYIYIRILFIKCFGIK